MRKFDFSLTKWIILCALLVTTAGCGGGSSGGSSGQTGQAGSTARFTVVDNYLYTVNKSNLKLFNISAPSNPIPDVDIFLDWGDIETIFRQKDSVLIGSRSGVFIYDTTDASKPEYRGEFFHATACDPVVAQDDFAYVTLREGNFCSGSPNQLEVIDISDNSKPTLLNSFPMENPRGLGVDGKYLFVCDGYAGLKVFDLVDPVYPSPVESLGYWYCDDLIAINGLLIVSDVSGVAQFTYDQENSPLKLRSMILNYGQDPTGIPTTNIIQYP